MEEKLENTGNVQKWRSESRNTVKQQICFSYRVLESSFGTFVLAIGHLCIWQKYSENDSYLRNWAFSLLSGCMASAISTWIFVFPFSAGSRDIHVSNSVINLWISESSIKGRRNNNNTVNCFQIRLFMCVTKKENSADRYIFAIKRQLNYL